MKYLLVYISVIVLFFTSCECHYQITGVVLDSETKEAIKEVHISAVNSDVWQPTYITKADGTFQVSIDAANCDKKVYLFSKTGYDMKVLGFENNTINDTIWLERTKEIVPSIFDQSKPFSVKSHNKRVEQTVSDELSELCTTWSLEKEHIQTIIQESAPINTHDWHYLFGHYPCSVEGQIEQNQNSYMYEVNSGAWLSISSADTTWYYGSYKELTDSFFLDTRWKEMTGE